MVLVKWGLTWGWVLEEDIVWCFAVGRGESCNGCSSNVETGTGVGTAPCNKGGTESGTWSLHFSQCFFTLSTLERSFHNHMKHTWPTFVILCHCYKMLPNNILGSTTFVGHDCQINYCYTQVTSSSSFVLIVLGFYIKMKCLIISVRVKLYLSRLQYHTSNRCKGS